jgi:TPR repeat protein
LAMLYATGPGQGVSVDRVEAYRWLILAAASGSEDSAGALRRLQNVMTPQQLREAHLRAYGWRSRPVPDLAQESLLARTSVALSDTVIEP